MSAIAVEGSISFVRKGRHCCLVSPLPPAVDTAAQESHIDPTVDKPKLPDPLNPANTSTRRRGVSAAGQVFSLVLAACVTPQSHPAPPIDHQLDHHILSFLAAGAVRQAARREAFGRRSVTSAAEQSHAGRPSLGSGTPGGHRLGSGRSNDDHHSNLSLASASLTLNEYHVCGF